MGVLPRRRSAQVIRAKWRRQITHPPVFLDALLPVSSPASSTSLIPSGLLLPCLLLPPLIGVSLPWLLKLAAIRLSTTFCISRRYSYSMPRPTIMKKETTKEDVDEICHWGNTMQVSIMLVFLLQFDSTSQLRADALMLMTLPEHAH